MSILKKLKEQGVEKFKGGTADLQDLSGPNKPVGASEREQHHGLSEEDIEEDSTTTTSIGGNHRPKKTFPNANKAGAGLRQRSGAQAGGNQGRSVATYTEEAIRTAKKKISEKKGEQPLGRTSTNQPSDTIDTSPEKPELH